VCIRCTKRSSAIRETARITIRNYRVTTTNLFAADKYISIIDIDINYTAAGCQRAIQLSMLAACNFNNNVLS